MMNVKKFPLYLAFTLVASAFADDTRFDRRTDEKPKLAAQEIRDRFELRGELFVLDATGRVLEAASGDSRTWSFGAAQSKMESHWAVVSNLHRPVLLHQIWELESDGRLKYRIEQYEKGAERRPGEKANFRNLVKKQEGYLENFASINFRSELDKDKVIVVRLVPTLRPKERSLDLSMLPITGTDVVVVDNRGYRWTDRLDFEGKYVWIESHRGAIAFSFAPFEGAQRLGYAEGHRIELNVEPGLRVSLVSRTPFALGDGKAPIYALYRPKRRSQSPSSTGTSTSDDLPDFLKRIKDGRS